MKKNRSTRRKGFTLVELLIVIVVIGVLSAMMMLSSTEAVSSARASNIISNLRNWKTAALAWYVDNINKVDDGTVVFADDSKSGASKDIAKYLNSQSAPGYKLANDGKGGWYIQYGGSGVNNATLDDNIVAKLNARRTSVGLLHSANSKDTTAITTTGGVFMFVR